MMTSSNGNIFRVTDPLCGSPVNSPNKGQRRWAVIFSLICASINTRLNNREAGLFQTPSRSLWRSSYANAICPNWHYNDVIMGAIASQITSVTIVYSTVYSDADQRKHQSSSSLAFVRGIQRGPVNSPHKWPVTRKMFPFDDVIMGYHRFYSLFIIDQ